MNEIETVTFVRRFHINIMNASAYRGRCILLSAQQEDCSSSSFYSINCPYGQYPFDITHSFFEYCMHTHCSTAHIRHAYYTFSRCQFKLISNEDTAN